MGYEVSHQPYSAFAVYEQCMRWDCGCSAAALNPADSPFEQKRIEKQFEDAGLCCSPGSCCTTFLHFQIYPQEHIMRTSVSYIGLNALYNL